MKNETIKRWTDGLRAGAAVTWIVLIIGLLVVAATQSGCSTARAMGKLVQAFGEDMEGAAEGIERQIVERN